MTNPFNQLRTIEPALRTESLSCSDLDLAQTCERKYYWSKKRKLTNRKLAIPLYVGSCFHKGMEVFYDGFGEDEVKQEVIQFSEDYLKETPPAEYQEGDLKAADAMITASIEAYLEYYKDDAKHWDVVGTEIPVGMWVASDNEDDQFYLCGTLDLVYVDKRTGKLIICDFKTAASLPDFRIQNLVLDKQVQLYTCMLESITGVKVDFFLYSVVLKPAIRLKKDETYPQFVKRLVKCYQDTPDKYFIRHFQKRSQRDIDNVVDNVVDYAEYLVTKSNNPMGLAAEMWPINNKACGGPFGNSKCAYWDMCVQGETVDKTMRYSEREERYVVPANINKVSKDAKKIIIGGTLEGNALATKVKEKVAKWKSD